MADSCVAAAPAVGMENSSPMGLAYNPNPRTLTWERLEKMRLKKIGLQNRYSRHLSEIIRMTNQPNLGAQGRQQSFELSGSYQVESELSYTDSPSAPSGALQAMKEARQPSNKKDGKGKDIRKNNSLAPFATLGKPTCGFFFADSTNNRKAKFGIPPSDLVKWRNIPSQ